MRIKSSATLRNDYRTVADECIATGEPTFITNNGEGELVVMSIDAYEQQKEDLKIQKSLLEYELDKARGEVTYKPVNEVREGVGKLLSKLKEDQAV